MFFRTFLKLQFQPHRVPLFVNYPVVFTAESLRTQRIEERRALIISAFLHGLCVSALSTGTKKTQRSILEMSLVPND